ncbi:6-pyruvoyl tetrahydropterin synthase [Nesterenkonia sp. AN1]|uniref:6-carboxy-5,6,7,8-tetrahydropterin synthase n=1 Tax=Nesterenkonia aurantiaca TaxID=1436010 RepID=A0A4R7FZ68_9MICC|nr:MULTISPECIES: 6-carboxytetrahydropterin synthase [Nesterenkonia]EXF25849.1 6-pyruvoyl tetrahydropterin synthase [Nesterenkonia sp. AN1]MBO0595656.1 6-carboxytetrahydropterin synthase [Nesterenkonia sp. E16_10]MBO0598537.1 6-carboxytetrahydropterin synthase [Nesterenkonia sp. E16_7]TDS84193.1 6-pyruvoyl-tetrahydropterin synthase [Nesterenkonia aurantiaca]
MSRFRLTVDDHIMIAHSLQDPFFGPAQNLHGATLSIQASFFRDGLNEYGVVLDIGAATELLAATLEPLRYKNLDELEALAGKFTTTEVIIEHIAETLAAELPADHGLTALEVQAEEHPRARASVWVQL